MRKQLMAGSPRIVTEDRTIEWDGVSQRLPRGQVIDVPPGSKLEDAIGAEHLVPLGATAAQPPPEPEPAVAEKPAPAKPRTAATGKTVDAGADLTGEGKAP
jgi:hypothetical protein